LKLRVIFGAMISRAKKIWRAALAAAGAAALVITGVALGPASAVPNYPSAAEVAEAKKNVRDKQAMIERLEGYIAELEIEAEDLGRIALIKNEEYNLAVGAVTDMRSKVDGLTLQVAEAEESAGFAQSQLAQIVARMYRTGTSGNTTLELFFNPEGTEDLLYQLSAHQIVAQRTESIYQSSLDQQAQAQSLAAELAGAQVELEGLEAAAKKVFEEAKAAADAVARKVAENERANRQLISQLADLRDTAEELERQRAEGLAAEARQRAVRTPPTAPELYSVGAPNSSQVETAIAFAEQQLGKRYVLGGAGPDVWDCSGITMKAYAAAGVYIGWHSATAQFRVLANQKKLVPFQDAQRGDLIWWTTSRNWDGDKYHVAIYLGNGMMLEAPNPARSVRIVPVRYGELFPYAGRPTASPGN
jgi:peptidoglycan DL-endopeptidase CwlO